MGMSRRVVSVFVLALSVGLLLTAAAGAAERKIVVWDWEPPEIVAKYQAALDRWQKETGIKLEYQQV
ncbi:MAG: hypothetical protein AB1609_05345, partial [Bacillota bacterium]